MDIHTTTASPSSSTTNHHPTTTTTADPMHQWWESISKARLSISSLSSILPLSSLSLLADSDRPSLSLLASSAAYSAVSDYLLHSPNSGSGPDPLCQWLYDTYLSSDPDLRLVVLSYLPLVTNLYLSNTVNASVNSLAGFEAVLLAIYAGEVRTRGGQALTVSVPDLSLPSLYHSPRSDVAARSRNLNPRSVGVVCKVLEPLSAVKSTKRACVVGVAMDCFYGKIALMPSWCKVDLCVFVSAWAGQDCACKDEFDRVEVLGFSDGRDLENDEDDGEIVRRVDRLNVNECDDDDDSVSKGVRVPLPWELLQPIVKILGHCLLGPLSPDEVRDAASTAVRCLYARASHELVPQAILATRSLIQLDKRSRAARKMAVDASNAASNANTPSKAKKPEILLVSK